MLAAFQLAPQAPDVVGCRFGGRRGEDRLAARGGLGKRNPLVNDAGELATCLAELLFGLARDGWRNRDPWRLAPAALTLTILVFASSFSRINIGIRHVLILYPFFAIGGAWALTRAW